MYLIVTSPSGFEKFAKKEIEEILRDSNPNVAVDYTYFKGILLAKVDYTWNEISEKLASEETHYINRVVPVAAEFKNLGQVLDFFESFNLTGKKFAVRCNRRGSHPFSGRDVEVQVGAVLNKRGGTVDLEDPELVAIVEILQDRFFVGSAKPSEILVKRPAVGRKWAKGERPVSRAELKMREVIKRYPWIFQKNCVALDIGAAPGGWTRAMAQKVKKVIAVDPGELDEGVAALGNVVHIKKRAEDIGLAEALEIIANDMNITPQESAKISILMARKYLRKGGHLVHTVKFGKEPGTGRPVAKSLNHDVLEVIREFKGKGFEILSKSKLKYNTRNEATIVARYLGNEE